MMIQEKPSTLEECFNRYIKKCEIKNMSARTIKLYQSHYEDFITRCKISSISEVNAEIVDSYIIQKRTHSKCNDITINSYLRSIRAFLYWCMEQKYLIPFVVTIPKADKKIKETYTDSELQQLLEKPDLKKVSFNQYKIWVLTNYLIGTGNRISTALALKVKNLDFDNNLITLEKTKNRKQQIIPMSYTLKDILLEYLSYRSGESEDFVFCNSYGLHANLRTVQQSIADYNHARGVIKTSCHLYRHTFAKNWILNGGDIFRLQKILGHSDLTVVREYVNMFSNDVGIDFNKFNPLDNLELNRKKNSIKMK